MKLGKIQLEVLKCLKEHGMYAQGFSGWVWGTHSLTRRTLDALKKKGAVKIEHREPYHGSVITRDVYTITPEGLKALEKLSV